ncbi:hypothetical protein EJB05_32053, partial [Eragrostis curvula]
MTGKDTCLPVPTSTDIHLDVSTLGMRCAAAPRPPESREEEEGRFGQDDVVDIVGSVTGRQGAVCRPTDINKVRRPAATGPWPDDGRQQQRRWRPSPASKRNGFSTAIISREYSDPLLPSSPALSHSRRPHANDSTPRFDRSQQCVVLDIEGTTTPISFVTDVLFPYARDNVRKHLGATYGTDETKDDIALLRAQVEQDLAEAVAGAVPVPPDEAGKDKVIDALVANVQAMIKADRKITSLKQLQCDQFMSDNVVIDLHIPLHTQGHVWRTGFEGQEIKGVVFEDVPPALEKWHASGIKTYIYSSGSREAQRLIFGNTTYGDLRKYLCGFFDTTVGTKREARSYYEIWQSVGTDRPSQILFLTDVYQEATAAKAAGLEVLISIRPGNAPLPENHRFQTIASFAEILT